MPGHHKGAERNAEDKGTVKAQASEIFRRQEKGIYAKGFGKSAVYRAEQDKPEKEQYLVFPEMQNEQLNGKRII